MNFKLIFITVALVACGMVDGKLELKQRFSQWSSKYGFAHESPFMQEKRFYTLKLYFQFQLYLFTEGKNVNIFSRFKIFKQNFEKIDAQNEKYLN